MSVYNGCSSSYTKRTLSDPDPRLSPDGLPNAAEANPNVAKAALSKAFTNHAREGRPGPGDWSKGPRDQDLENILEMSVDACPDDFSRYTYNDGGRPQTWTERMYHHSGSMPTRTSKVVVAGRQAQAASAHRMWTPCVKRRTQTWPRH